MMYFDSRVVVGFMIFTLVMIALSWWRHSVTRTLIWFGAFFLSLQNALAVKATIDLGKDYQASMDDGSLHALSGFAALPEKVFTAPVTAALVFFAAAAVWWVLERIGITRKLGAMYASFRGKTNERKAKKASSTPDSLDMFSQA
jgi:Flp pilus assembly protein TadB